MSNCLAHDPHQVVFGNLLTHIFKAYQVPLGVDKAMTKKDMIDHHIALECDYVPAPIVVVVVTPTPTSLKATRTLSQIMGDH